MTVIAERAFSTSADSPRANVPPPVEEHARTLAEILVLGLFVVGLAMSAGIQAFFVFLGASRSPLPLYVLGG